MTSSVDGLRSTLEHVDSGLTAIGGGDLMAVFVEDVAE